ncbi:hypothetical protein MNBD_GAMMA22-1629 [hydrothermal vent metagenome]|uniref:Jacalin-type lectin domain-containing protein n=1 Tax=hydrothermal vent metagenome TaxID=652676 RepID=A0A3B1APZ6_9ZZZZ
MSLINTKSIRQFLLATCATLILGSPVFAGHDVQGPSGGISGTSFSDFGASNEKINTIWVRAGAWIDSVHTQFISTGGVLRTTPHRGGFGGGFNTITLAANEDVTSVTGYYNGSYVQQLRVRTSLGNTYTYGNAVGRFFSYYIPDGAKFAGFRGASGSFVDSIGAIWRPQ